MNRKPILACALSALAFAIVGSSAFAAPPALSFGRREAIQSAAISPDGQQVALISGTAYERSLSISTIDKDSPVVLSLGDVRTSSLRWAGDGYVLVRVTRYEKPVGLKYAYNLTRDLIFDASSGKLKGWLLDSSAESGLVTALPIYKVIHGDKPAAYVEGLDANVGQATNNTRFKEDHSIVRPVLWKVDVGSGHATVVDRSSAADYAIDADGDLRGRLDRVDSVNDNVRYEERAYTVYGRGKGQSSWKAMVTVKGRGVGLLGYSGPDDALYWVQEDGARGVSQIHKVSFKDGSTSLVPTPEGAVDVSMRFDPQTDQPLAIVYNTGSGERIQWIEPKFGAAHAALSRLFKGKTVDLMNWSLDRSRFIIRVWSSSEPASWYMFDPGRKEVSALGDEYPELKGQTFATKTYFTYKARDGLEIPAYLHVPGGSSAKNLPLVVLPHGGPASRDDDDFDWWAQFLASRGYAVLQPQFRGSDGFGYDFREAGRQEWAGKMQLDLVDGIKDLAAKGVIDPQRVCIVGASYGGYAALYGMTSLQDAYKCGVSVNGVSDPSSFIVQLGRRYGDDPLLSEVFGENREQVAAGSPLQNAARTKGPILLIYSAEDTTVPPEQTSLMADRLKQAGRPVTVVQLKGDDHHLMTSSSRVEMLTAIDEFLAKNLPPQP
jgi:dipeptidyl aminopeptidase/acylaminoacyl peptidase